MSAPAVIPTFGTPHSARALGAAAMTAASAARPSQAPPVRFVLYPWSMEPSLLLTLIHPAQRGFTWRAETSNRGAAVQTRAQWRCRPPGGSKDGPFRGSLARSPPGWMLLMGSRLLIT